MGRFIDYNEYIRSDAWIRKRDQRLALDNYQCKKCGTAKNLIVHHITYKNLGHENMDDLVTLCWNCHNSVHKNDTGKSNKRTQTKKTPSKATQKKTNKNPETEKSKKRPANMKKNEVAEIADLFNKIETCLSDGEATLNQMDEKTKEKLVYTDEYFNAFVRDFAGYFLEGKRVNGLPIPIGPIDKLRSAYAQVNQWRTLIYIETL